MGRASSCSPLSSPQFCVGLLSAVAATDYIQLQYVQRSRYPTLEEMVQNVFQKQEQMEQMTVYIY